MVHALDALGNPLRREIMMALRETPLSVNELSGRFPISRPAISRHLRVLTEGGLLEQRPEGARNVYAVRVSGLAPVREFLDVFWDVALARLAARAEE